MLRQGRAFERFSAPNSVSRRIAVVMANTQWACRNLGDVDATREDYVPPVKNDYLLHYNLAYQCKHLGVVIDVGLLKAIARIPETTACFAFLVHIYLQLTLT